MANYELVLLALPYITFLITTFVLCITLSVKETVLNLKGCLLLMLFYLPVLILSLLSSIVVNSSEASVIGFQISQYFLPFLGLIFVYFILYSKRKNATTLTIKK